MAKTKDLLIKEASDAQALVLQVQQQAEAQIAAADTRCSNRIGELQAAQDLANKAKDECIAKLEKELKVAKESSTMWLNNCQRAQDELELLHVVLDTIPGSPPRELKPNPDAYTATKLSTIARFAGYFANRQQAH